MDTAICKEVIIPDILRRGNGTPDSPIRIIKQVFEKDGQFIAEHDPVSKEFSYIDLINFANYCLPGGSEKVGEMQVMEWRGTTYRL